MYRFTATGDELHDWTQWVQEAKHDIPPYPDNRHAHMLTSSPPMLMHACRFSGRGIVIAAGGFSYFTSAYVSLRVMREVHKCRLPIEVFYADDDELPPVLAKQANALFDNVKWINIQHMAGFPKGVSMKGYQIKPFSILFSSFREVLFLDADNIPAEDPSIVFELAGYKATGALFWSDICNTHSCRVETWDVMGLPRPKAWTEFDTPFSFRITETCPDGKPVQLETGQIVMDKKRVWAALMMTVFINRNYAFFYQRLMYGDCPSFSMGFNVTGLAYTVSSKHLYLAGLKVMKSDGDYLFSGNTMVQRHPETGAVLFMHRNVAKFQWAANILSFKPRPRAWQFLARQGAQDGWLLYDTSQLGSPGILYLWGQPGGIVSPDPRKMHIVPVPQLVWCLCGCFESSMYNLVAHVCTLEYWVICVIRSETWRVHAST